MLFFNKVPNIYFASAFCKQVKIYEQTTTRSTLAVKN